MATTITFYVSCKFHRGSTEKQENEFQQDMTKTEIKAFVDKRRKCLVEGHAAGYSGCTHAEVVATVTYDDDYDTQGLEA